METFGQFFDAVRGKVKAGFNPEAEGFLDEWVALVSAERWEEVRATELSEGWLQSFAEDMATYFAQRIQGICGDELWQHTIERGHEFLRAIAETGRQFGLNVEDSDVDVGLSPSDTIIRASGGVTTSSVGIAVVSPKIEP